MLLKRIEIHGFKSFADKTELEIGRGVTCLVGPNGCGKSNVVDALKWSLGEQRASALRGDSMSDVIFKGNGNRPAMSFAEVTLVFDNESGELQVDAPEVAVTRRLLRSGESEYLLNRQPVRLRDVRELFVDTGLGANAYAVLEQGKIDAVLRANPVERRSLFEEAAGIQRFRLRKKEAARKLEKVDQNLLRVADLAEELERRERSLKVQAGRARSYVQLTGRLTELKTVQYLAAGAEMARRCDELREKLLAARDGDAAADVALKAAGAAVEAADLEAQSARDRAAELRTREAEARSELDGARMQAQQAQERVEESQREAQERGERAAEHEREGEARRGELATREGEAAQFDAELEAARGAVAERRSAVEAAEREERERAAELESLRREATAATQAELAASNRATAVDTRLRGLRQARERIVRREAELAGMLARVRSEASAVATDLDRFDRAAKSHAESFESARDELASRRERERELRIAISDLNAERAAKASRRDTLASVIEKMEGVDEGSRRLLKAAREDGARHRGVRGLLGELLAVSRDKARAVDAALGALAGAVVVDDVAALRRSLEFLREQAKGPATFLVLETAQPVTAHDGAPGEALLETGEGGDLAPLAAALLGNARIVGDEDALLACLGSRTFAVTADGMRLEPSGAFQDRPQKRTLGFVERKSELLALKGEIDGIEQRLRRMADEEARISGEVAEWTARVAEAERLRREAEDGLAQTRSASERLADRAQIFRRDLKVSARERYDLERECKERGLERAGIESELVAQRARREAIEERRAELAQIAERRQEALQGLVEAAAAASRDVVRVEERARSARSELQMMRRGLEELERMRERLLQERLELEARGKRAAEERERLAVAIEECRAELEEVSAAIVTASESEDAARARSAQARQGALEAASRREDVRAALHRLEIEERELELSQSNLRLRAREEISLELDEKLAEFDVASAPPIDQVASEVGDLRDRISRLGNVNLDAIHELEEVEQRLAFLIREREDLDASRRSLEETIKELDAISREKFAETFNTVREHFRVMFRKLFHGGRADIMLTEGMDVLEAGIEIIAGPPGKDPRSITLLSGGERTMTAVGLLFALFKAKPAPVAVLDEVDAALDEANTERFCALLAEFIGQSQFLIVTHSKRTMSYADVIFGVTMQENGVSKRIGIRLEDVEKSGQGQVA
jgi:chromosome segregation protein